MSDGGQAIVGGVLVATATWKLQTPEAPPLLYAVHVTLVFVPNAKLLPELGVHEIDVMFRPAIVLAVAL